MKRKRCVAIMLDLEMAHARHTEVFAGAQRFATVCGSWECEIDEIVDHRLPANGKGYEETCPAGQVLRDSVGKCLGKYANKGRCKRSPGYGSRRADRRVASY